MAGVKAKALALAERERNTAIGVGVGFSLSAVLGFLLYMVLRSKPAWSAEASAMADELKGDPETYNLGIELDMAREDAQGWGKEEYVLAIGTALGLGVVAGVAVGVPTANPGLGIGVGIGVALVVATLIFVGQDAHDKGKLRRLMNKGAKELMHQIPVPEYGGSSEASLNTSGDASSEEIIGDLSTVQTIGSGTEPDPVESPTSKKKTNKGSEENLFKLAGEAVTGAYTYS